MTRIDTSTPAVVFRSFDYQGLAVMRSLGRMGVPVYGMDPDPWSAGMRSRYCRGRFSWDIDGSSPEENIDHLLRTARAIGRPSVLFNFSDPLAVLVADHADALKEWFLFPVQSPALVRSLVSKKKMHVLATNEGIAAPATRFPMSREDVIRACDEITFPAMLKGSDGDALQARAGRTMAIIRTAEELLRMYDLMEDPANPDLMLQEYIPGEVDTVWMFNGYFGSDSECLVAWTGRKIRQAPAYTGATSLGVCVENDIVERTTKHFMKRIGYRGILDIGYRYDARDGRFKVLDANPRIGATFRLFVGDDGVDVARAAYLDLTGQAIPVSRMRSGRKWFVEDRDLVSSIRYWRDRKLTIGAWVRSFRGVEESAYFAGDDLVPFLVMCWRGSAKLLRKGIARVSRGIFHRWRGAGRGAVSRLGVRSSQESQQGGDRAAGLERGGHSLEGQPVSHSPHDGASRAGSDQHGRE